MVIFKSYYLDPFIAIGSDQPNGGSLWTILPKVPEDIADGPFCDARNISEDQKVDNACDLFLGRTDFPCLEYILYSLDCPEQSLSLPSVFMFSATIYP